jgi:peptidoglycan/xylan/chitin deacetylase (PgdA/CDA1 family)
MPRPSFLPLTTAGTLLPALGLAAPVAVPFAWAHSVAAGTAALGLMAGAHGALLAGTLRPNCQWFGPVITGFQPAGDEVWLTIDDGPDPHDTPRLLDLLDAAGARATFFVRGDRARAYPELVAEIARHGHQLGNHTFSHPQATFWALGPVRLRREIESCNAALREITHATPRLFRAPVGMVNPFVPPAVDAAGLRLVGWSARGFDGVVRHARDADAVVARILSTLRPGGIALLHEGRRGPSGDALNVRPLAGLLEVLARRNWRCVLPEETRWRCGPVPAR